MDLNQFLNWAYEKKTRYVTITIEKGEDPVVIVGEDFDSRYVCQARVKEVKEIDLEGKMEKDDRKAYEQLRKKYGPGK